MKHELDNKYVPFAISIMNNDKVIGYVPNTEIKEFCKNNITETLKIINIKIIKGKYGIRVIPKCFYVYDATLESKVFFSND